MTWSETLSEFKNKRGHEADAQEQLWLYMQYKCRKLAQPQINPGVAAAANNTNAHIANAGNSMCQFEFASQNGEYKLTLMLTHASDRDSAVKVLYNMRDGKPGGRLSLTGETFDLPCDAEWRELSYTKFDDAINLGFDNYADSGVLRLQYMNPDGEIFDLFLSES